MNKIELKPNVCEYVLPVFIVLSLITSCIIISDKKYFWNDELYSYYLLNDKSFINMLAAFHDKINNTPPLYFILGWLWVRVFGSTEISLRLFSSIGICIAAVIVWLILRKSYNFLSTSIGVVSVFCSSNIVIYQNSEARMYGLFTALCALGLLQYTVLNKTSKDINWKYLLPNICVHAAIVNTHLFGLFYSGAILLSLIIRDNYLKCFRIRIYISIFLSWFSLVIYIPSFINQSDAGYPRSWIPIPSLNDLTNLLNFSSSSFINLILLLLLFIHFIIYAIFCKKYNLTYSSNLINQDNKRKKEITPFLLIAFIFITTPILIWVISHTFKPILVDRYMIPSALGWSILLCQISSYVIIKPKFLKTKFSQLQKTYKFIITVWLVIVFVLLITAPINYAINVPKEKLPEPNIQKTNYNILPVVVQSSHDFLKIFHYSPQRKKYFFILDWESAVDIRSGNFGSQEYKHLDAFRRNYPDIFQENIVESENFLNRNKKFLVLDYTYYIKDCNFNEFHCPQWLEIRVNNNPDYKITVLDNIDDRKLLLVEKLAP
ncbi:hypothetical protein BLD44_007770 [Mastigocladus laminosus UU774]|nr:hypothetical protein BLD44_007770 [Mastigocladus laminosus UU774]